MTLEQAKVLRRLEDYSKFLEGHKLFLGAKNHGYGVICFQGRKSVYVHRISAWIFLGLDLNDTQKLALHKVTCKYKHCWSPDCLYIGDHSDNVRDSYEAGRIHPSLRKDNLCTRCGREVIGDNLKLTDRGTTRRCRYCTNKTARAYKLRRKGSVEDVKTFA